MTVVEAMAPCQASGLELHWRRDGASRAPILKDRGRGKYYQLSVGRALVWSLCDGTRTVDMICQRVADLGGPADGALVRRILGRLAGDGLITGFGPAVSLPLQNSQDGGLAQWCRRLLTWRVTFTGTDRPASFLYRRIGVLLCTRKLFPVLLAIMGLGVVAYVTTGRAFGVIDRQSVWWLPLAIYGTVLLHETAHAMATKHFGREVIGAGAGWFWLGPVCYVDTSDMWLADRRARILVSLAGPASDLVVAGMCSLAALLVSPHWAAHLHLLSGALYLIVICNLSPLLEYDGYYALADLLNRPNLRQHAIRWICNEFHFGRTGWHDIVRHRVEALYGAGSLLYMAALLLLNAHANLMFFRHALDGSAPEWVPVPLAWAITVLLFVVFLSGLLSEVKRLRVPRDVSGMR
jgi:putative peptide zinc metalloprotease protein